MKSLRPAAALVLIGWYFMIPPSIDNQAPLSQWEVTSSYDSASACEDAVRKSRNQAQAEYDHPSKPPNDWNHPTKDWPDYSRWLAQRFLAARCISTDDPRLAK
jgi:hypothetical protein